MKSSFLDYPFGRLHYQSSLTQKEKTIIFLHGNASSAESFSDISFLLKEKFNIICLDFPGHGLSDPVDLLRHRTIYSLMGLRDLFIDFYKKMGVENTFIVGNSLGANVAVWSLPFLKNVQGLISMASIHAKSKEDFFKNTLPAAPKDLALKKSLGDHEVEIVASAFIHSSRKRSNSFQKMSNDIRKSDGNFREQLVYHLDIQPWSNELQLLKDSALPFLYIGGLQDGFINPSFYEELIKFIRLADSQCQLLDQVSHVPHLESPECCAKLISEFITDLSLMNVRAPI